MLLLYETTLRKNNMKKLILIFALIANVAISQNSLLPQKSTFAHSFSADTIDKFKQGAYVAIHQPLCLHYNNMDSFFIHPIYWLPAQLTDTTYITIDYIDIVLVGNYNVTTASIKMIAPQLPTHSYGYKYNENFSASLVNKSYSRYVPEQNVTIITLKINQANFIDGAIGLKDVELMVNGRIFVPRQNREATSYFYYTNDFINTLYNNKFAKQ